MIQRPERRAHGRRLVDERVTISASGTQGLVVVPGTIVNVSPGGIAVELTADPGIDPDLAPDVILTRSTGSIRHLVLRALAIEDGILRAAFVDPPNVDMSDWPADERLGTSS